MYHTPPPKPTQRPPLAIKAYKTLPDASNAGLPPKPPVTPTNSRPSQFHSPGFHSPGLLPVLPLTPLTPSPKWAPRGQKRAYSGSSESIMVPYQVSPTPKYTKNVPPSGGRYNTISKSETLDRPAKIRRMTPPANVTNSTNTTINTSNASRTNTNTNTNSASNAGSASSTKSIDSNGSFSSFSSSNNSNNTFDIQKHPSGNKIHQISQNTAGEEVVRTKLRLIHNKLLGGATTLSERDQDYLKRQIDQNSTYLSPLMIKLIVMRVTNKNSSLAYKVMLWTYKRGDSKLLEHMLMELLYHFDVEEAFDQGLMSLGEVSDLMDCQMVLQALCNGGVSDAGEKEKTKIAKAGDDGNGN